MALAFLRFRFLSGEQTCNLNLFKLDTISKFSDISLPFLPFFNVFFTWHTVCSSDLFHFRKCLPIHQKWLTISLWQTSLITSIENIIHQANIQQCLQTKNHAKWTHHLFESKKIKMDSRVKIFWGLFVCPSSSFVSYFLGLKFFFWKARFSLLSKTSGRGNSYKEKWFKSPFAL